MLQVRILPGPLRKRRVASCWWPVASEDPAGNWQLATDHSSRCCGSSTGHSTALRRPGMKVRILPATLAAKHGTVFQPAGCLAWTWAAEHARAVPPARRLGEVPRRRRSGAQRLHRARERRAGVEGRSVREAPYISLRPDEAMRLNSVWALKESNLRPSDYESVPTIERDGQGAYSGGISGSLRTGTDTGTHPVESVYPQKSQHSRNRHGYGRARSVTAWLDGLTRTEVAA